MKKYPPIWVSYLKAGRLLHLVTLLETFLILLLSKNGIKFFPLQEEEINELIYLLMWGGPILAQLDARSRFQDYKLVKDLIYKNGFKNRYVRRFSMSRCQREAVRTAASELGCDKTCETYFKNRGYRYYHLLPDLLFDDPLSMLTFSFLKTTFFAAHYKSRYDFRKMDLPNKMENETGELSGFQCGYSIQHLPAGKFLLELKMD